MGVGRVPGREGTVTWEDGRALRGAGHRCGPSLGEAGRPTALSCQLPPAPRQGSSVSLGAVVGAAEAPWPQEGRGRVWIGVQSVAAFGRQPNDHTYREVYVSILCIHTWVCRYNFISLMATTKILLRKEVNNTGSRSTSGG